MANNQLESAPPSVITPAKKWFATPKFVIPAILILSILVLVIIKFGNLAIIYPKTDRVEKQAKMLQTTQKLDEQAALEKAQEKVEKESLIEKEAKKRGITVTQQEVEQEAQRLITKSGQEAINKTLQYYGWTEADWKNQLKINLLTEKLRASLAKWRDYQLLTIRWDDPLKPSLGSEDKSWEKAKEVLEKAKPRLEQGEDIQKIYTELQADSEVSKYFVVQALTKTQRIYSDTEITSVKLKQGILSTPPNSISQPIWADSFAALVKTLAGEDNDEGSLEEILNKQTFKFPTLIKTAYASHENASTCGARNHQYCAAGDYCYQEGVIRGFVKDPAGNPLFGAQVTAEYKGSNPKPTSCLCTDIISTGETDFNGRYSVHGLCCFLSFPYTVAATYTDDQGKPYECGPVNDLSISNGLNTDAPDILCTPPPCPVDPNSCDAAEPACGLRTTGKNNCNQFCEKNGPACPVCGRVTDASNGNPIPFIDIRVCNNSNSCQPASTNFNGDFKNEGFIKTGDAYAVRPPANAPPGYQNPPNPPAAGSYEGQNYGGNPSCSSLNSCGCNFKYPSPSGSPPPIPFNVTCAVSSTSNPPNIGDPVTWTADATGGTPPYTSYTWEGTAPLPRQTVNLATTVTYTSEGLKVGKVTVRDSLGQQSSNAPNPGDDPNCQVTINSPQSFTITASPACNGTASAINVSWKTVSGATSYQIFRNNSLINTIAASPIVDYEYLDAVGAGSTNTYKVTAVIPSGNKTSNNASATAESCAISQPNPPSFSTSASCSSTPGLQNIRVRWSDTNSYASYRVNITSGSTVGGSETSSCYNESSNMFHTFTNKSTGFNWRASIIFYTQLGCGGSFANTNSLPVTNANCAIPPPPPPPPPIPPPPPTFNFRLSNGGDKSVNRGSSVANQITVNLRTGTAQRVNLSAVGFPSGVTHSFSPVSCIPTCTSTLTMAASQTANIGTSPIVVTGVGGGLTRTTAFNLRVLDNQPPVANLVTTLQSCYNSNTWVGSPPQAIQASATDNVGVLAVFFRLTNLTSGTTSSDLVTFPGSPFWFRIFTNADLNNLGGFGHQYKVEVKAVDISGNSSRYEDALAGTFFYQDRCTLLSPWVETEGGDVHSNTRINTPGGE